jgi:hypothetical protein
LTRREARPLPLGDLFERRGPVSRAAEAALAAAEQQLLLPKWLGRIELASAPGGEISTRFHITTDGVRSIRVPAAIEVGEHAREKALGTLRQLGQILEEALVADPRSRSAYNELISAARESAPMRTLAAIKSDSLRAEQEYERVFERIYCQLVCSGSRDAALRSCFKDAQATQLLWWTDEEFAPLGDRLRELLSERQLVAA